ncbi:MAG: hypothetical protein J6S67_24895 [Methanobrevibacter sp.]|nr:hypothetical protein [Methanobrevibacter sp.]
MSKKNNQKQLKRRAKLKQEAEYKGQKEPVILNKDLVNKLEEGNEYLSLINLKPTTFNNNAIHETIRHIELIRNRPAVCYVANIARAIPNTILDYTDILPFMTMVGSIPKDSQAIDIILATPGGNIEIADFFAKQLRLRFREIGFIIPSMCMSAGTVFCLSGDEIIMDENAYLGPTDPQMLSNDLKRRFPGQTLQTIISDIQKRGEEKLKKKELPDWTDIIELNNIDLKELGYIKMASQLSIDLVEEYLRKYKFKNWTHHSGTNLEVTEDARKTRAREIATKLCNNECWKTHNRLISRTVAHEECWLQITHPEDIDGLNNAIKQFWTVVYWIIEHSNVQKIYATNSNCLFKNC